MLRLYDNDRSRNGYKIRLLLSHLGRPFEYVPVDIFKGQSRTPEFLAKNPAGRIPVLQIEDGTYLPESNAALFYLAHGTEFLPTNIKDQAHVLRWMFFEQNMVEPNVGSAILWQAMGLDRQRTDAFAAKVKTGTDALETMNRHLTQNDWLAANRFTIADIAAYAYTRYASTKGIFDYAPFAAISAWFGRIEALPRHVPSDWGVVAPEGALP